MHQFRGNVEKSHTIACQVAQVFCFSCNINPFARRLRIPHASPLVGVLADIYCGDSNHDTNGEFSGSKSRDDEPGEKFEIGVMHSADDLPGYALRNLHTWLTRFRS